MQQERFHIIPAVDLLDGKVVRLYRGDYSQVTVYHEDAALQIATFIEEGADLVHVVDLNAARNGDRSANRSQILKILSAAKGRAKIELGGGIRGMEALEEYDSLGVHRFILGSAAVSDPAFLEEALKRMGGERVIVGVDAKDGEVKVSGWEKGSGRRVDEFLPWLERIGVREIIFTDIRTDGTLSGPAIDSLRTILDHSSLRVIASGGISCLDDIRSLLAMDRPRLVGAITGRAVYENRLSVREAVDLVRRSP